MHFDGFFFSFVNDARARCLEKLPSSATSAIKAEPTDAQTAGLALAGLAHLMHRHEEEKAQPGGVHLQTASRKML